MRTLGQLRDQAKREAIDYWTDCVFFALVEDRIAETETHLGHLTVQRTDLEKIADQLWAEVASFQSEIAALNPDDELRVSLQQQLYQTQESLKVIETQIDTLEGDSKNLQGQIEKYRSVAEPKPPHGLEHLVVS